jgi:hypothetical protein
MSVTKNKPKSLAAIRERFLNLRDMAAELGTFSDFQGVQHPALVRWLKAEAEGKELPRRARRAIELMSAKRTESLRIPFHDSPVALPLMILEARGASATKAGGYTIERKDVPSGAEALIKVAKCDSEDGADIAFAWEDVKLGKAAKGKCAALCNYVSYDLAGIYLEREDRPIRTRVDLRKVKFGFPETSAVGEFLKSEITFDKAAERSPKGLLTAKEAAAALKKKEVDCLVGWHPWLSNAKKELASSNPKDLPAGLLPPIRLALFISRQSKKGPAILQLLRDLVAVVSDLDSALRALEETKLKILAKRIGVDESLKERDVILKAVKELVEGYDFRLSDADLDVFFCIWREADVAAK